jgi:hypothetical protein
VSIASDYTKNLFFRIPLKSVHLNPLAAMSWRINMAAKTLPCHPEGSQMSMFDVFAELK